MVQWALTKTNIANFILRLGQFVCGIVVIALYGIDLHHAAEQGKYSDSKWGYAVAVGSISAVTTFIFIIINMFFLYRDLGISFIWDIVLVILWTVVSGIFGKMYIGTNTEMESGIARMKTAVGFDLASLVLWFVSAVFGGVLFFFFREGRSLFTGQAEMGRGPSIRSSKRAQRHELEAETTPRIKRFTMRHERVK